MVLGGIYGGGNAQWDLGQETWLHPDGSACPPELAIEQQASFRETWITNTLKTFDNSYYSNNIVNYL
jgi:hypothetical protein